MFLGHRDGLAALVQADGHPDAAVFKVEGMSMALGAEADDGNFASAKGVEACVLIVIDAGGHVGFSG